jgi:hypothetical protein
MPAEYRSPFDHAIGSTATPYVVIVGEDTAWPGPRSLKEPEVEGETILVVEAGNGPTNWMQPKDIALDEAIQGINAPGGRGIKSNYPDMLPALTARTGTRFVAANTPPGVLRGLFARGNKR